MSRSTVVIELAADARFSRDLAAGGVFVPGCRLKLAEECDLMVRGAQHQLVLPARVVYVDPARGAGLEVVGFSGEIKAKLAALEPVHRPSSYEMAARGLDPPVLEESVVEEATHDGALEALPGEELEPAALVELQALDDDLAVPMALLDDAAGDTDAYRHHAGDEADYAATGDEPDSTDTAAYPVVQQAAMLEDGDEAAKPARRTGRSSGPPVGGALHDRLRGLDLAAQLKLAVNGEQHERIMLERLYGKNVWETLLRNPRLTAPEVSRIARYGTLPRVLLEVILNNNAWLQVPEVRRALLANPRLGTDQVIKVLRLTPKHELKLAAIQTAYPQAVRNAAKALLKSG